MLRVLIASLMAFALPVLVSAPAFARAMESGDAAAAQQGHARGGEHRGLESEASRASPAILPRRVKAYGSGFIIDPSGIIVTNKHVIDGAIDIKVIFSNGDRLPGHVARGRGDARPRGAEGGCRPASAGAEVG